MNPTLYIIGAGPGDPELISLKGARLLKQADIILYDALVSPELLRYAKSGCKLIYAGKRKDKHQFSQDEINELLVYYASCHGCVVRLKGGDPYVFGRGHEELEYALRHGIRTEVIPGISSALAGLTAANIPLTRRGINESFWVITGTLTSGEFSNDIQLAAKSSATIIIMMGVSHLSEIISTCIEARSPLEPVAIIEHATLPSQRVITGSAACIVKKAIEHEVRTPAIIVVGKVVSERNVIELLCRDEVVNFALTRENDNHIYLESQLRRRLA